VLAFFNETEIVFSTTRTYEPSPVLGLKMRPQHRKAAPAWQARSISGDASWKLDTTFETRRFCLRGWLLSVEPLSDTEALDSTLTR